jgi:hypothetical protein
MPLGLLLFSLVFTPLLHAQAPATPIAESPVSPLDPSQIRNPFHRGILGSAIAGADWISRNHRPDGLFLYGLVPSLDRPLDEDYYLRQVGGAFALARAARVTGDEIYTVKARQAVLALLASTVVDPKDPTIRYPRFPSAIANRLGGAGLLVLTIHELPEPAEDLLEQAEQLCRYIHKQQKEDGSLTFQEHVLPLATGFEDDREGINFYPGEALYGVILSHRRKPAAWKLDCLRRALAYYRAYWREDRNKSTAFVPWQTSAYTEAYLITGEKAFAEFVLEMTDWILTLQLNDPSKPLYLGGFGMWLDGKPLAVTPRIVSASFAEGLADACRTARQLGDTQRFNRYSRATESCLQFLTTLQYTSRSTSHFTDAYRPRVLGAFHASHQDGTVRVDYTQHSICAMFQYLEHIGGVGRKAAK